MAQPGDNDDFPFDEQTGEPDDPFPTSLPLILAANLTLMNSFFAPANVEVKALPAGFDPSDDAAFIKNLRTAPTGVAPNLI